MSSILKALKKAEQESPDPESPNRSPFRLNVRTTLTSRMQHQRQKLFLTPKKAIFSLGVALIMASASYLLFFPDRVIQKSPASPPAAPHQAASTTPVEKNTPKTPARPPIENPGISSEPPAPKVTAHQTQILPPPAVKEIPAQQEQDIQEKAPEPVSQPVSKPAPRKEEILPLKDGTLNIQAISWAKNPSDRIAVINTKIVGEGESVQGYRILEIAQDEVIFEFSGQKFRLAFNYR
ncbi:MAG: general secretion pathway protein GspB [Desulfobacula sp.]|jgi:hypothetical protein